MQKKLTITVDERIYSRLHSVIGRGNISRFIERIARPYLFPEDLARAYGEMAADKKREQQAQEWVEALTSDIADETR
jgi:hypothetical protein